jgi:hypothetical protein
MLCTWRRISAMSRWPALESSCVSENEVMACTSMAEKTRAMMRGSRSGRGCSLIEHLVQQRLAGKGQHQAGNAVD